MVFVSFGLAALTWSRAEGLPAKRVALVFDDGPRPGDAGPLLELLAKEKVTATFSFVGDRVKENPGAARAVVAAGHEVANHSLTHVHPRTLDDAALAHEVSAAQQLIASTTGFAPKWYWPPYLEVDDRLRATVAKAGLEIYSPNHLVVSRDYDVTVPPPEIFHRATTDVRDGTVILFHEWRAETREQLPAILKKLRADGCEFLTFSALRASLAREPPRELGNGSRFAELSLVEFAASSEKFPLAHHGALAPLFVASDDWPGVARAAADLRDDIGRVTQRTTTLSTAAPAGAQVVLIGTIGKSALIDGLVAAGKLDVSAICGRWEAFQIEAVEHPVPGVDRALVIAGSDKRGTIYGVYQLSEAMGVSPWSWWADVPVARHDELSVATRRYVEPGPAVKYRGIFLNDEAPALAGWAQEKFGGLNHKFYARLFELMLRLRANYLWPAMWNNAFNEDDPDNARLADEDGVVMGTSHHEPMLRAQQEWKRHGTGEWNYATNGETLRKFWSDGLRRNRGFESIVTIGMRGDGDLAMSEETNVGLLERIVADQRQIIHDATGKDPAAVPQLWALYKEVQAYYEHGMRVPDDVTLLWCDDNWGNLRRLPTAAERARPGGAGVYYHFDYVGDPRNYKWINTVPLTKIWEQMHLASQYGADRIWIVNVGDLKPMEFPTEFFLRYAWRPEAIPYDELPEYSRRWAARQFGAAAAAEVAHLIDGYTKLNGRRKPEMIDAQTFSVVNDREAERVLGEWRALSDRAGRLDAQLPAETRAAFFELVRQPIEAARIVNELQVAAGRNRLYARQGRASTNAWAARAREWFESDAALTAQWDKLLDGKWRHMMDQTHLGYTTWQQPVRNAMPPVTEVQVPARGELGLAVEGDADARPGDFPIPKEARLPPLSRYGASSRWFEVFDRGRESVRFAVEKFPSWLRFSATSGEVGPDARIEVSVDWPSAPRDRSEARFRVRDVAGGQPIEVVVPVDGRPVPAGAWVEEDGVVAIEAPHFTRAVDGTGVTWKTLAGFGRTLGGVTTFPVTAPPIEPTKDSAHLDYEVWLSSTGDFAVDVVCAPSLDFQPGQPLRWGISLDDEAPQVIELKTGATQADWERAVGDGVRHSRAKIKVTRAGLHTVRLWRVTSGVVFERVVIDTGGVRPSYLGPPESGRSEKSSSAASPLP